MRPNMAAGAHYTRQRQQAAKQQHHSTHRTTTNRTNQPVNQGTVNALWSAASKGNLKAVAEFACKTDINAQAQLTNGQFETALYAAVRNDHIDIINYLLNDHADPDVGSTTGDTPLRLAAAKGSLDIVKALVHAGAQVNKPGHKNGSALAYAANSGHKDMVQFLILSKSNVDCQDEWGNSAIMAAIKCKDQHQSLELVRILIAAGANKTYLSEGTKNPLNKAVLNKNVELARILLEEGEPISVPTTALHVATCLDDADASMKLTELFLKHGASINEQQGLRGLTSLHYARTPDMIDFLLKNSAVINPQLTANDQTTPLMDAAEFKTLDICRLLVDRGAEVHQTDRSGQTMLHYAIRGGKEENIRFFLEQFKPISPELGKSLVTKALSPKLIPKTLRLLHEAGVDIDFELEDRKTPLLKLLFRLSTTKDKEEIASMYLCLEVLLECGAKVHDSAGVPFSHRLLKESSDFTVLTFLFNKRPDLLEEKVEGLSPLNFVLSNTGLGDESRTSIAKDLLALRADPSSSDASGKTALHFAATLPNLDILRQILERYAKKQLIDSIDLEGNTPLFLAARNYDFVMNTLLNAGANLYHQNLRGSDIAWICCSTGHLQGLKLLKDKSYDFHRYCDYHQKISAEFEISTEFKHKLKSDVTDFLAKELQLYEKEVEETKKPMNFKRKQLIQLIRNNFKRADDTVQAGDIIALAQHAITKMKSNRDYGLSLKRSGLYQHLESFKTETIELIEIMKEILGPKHAIALDAIVLTTPSFDF